MLTSLSVPPLRGGVHRILSNPMNEDAEPRLINRGMSRLIRIPSGGDSQHRGRALKRTHMTLPPL